MQNNLILEMYLNRCWLRSHDRLRAGDKYGQNGDEQKLTFNETRVARLKFRKLNLIRFSDKRQIKIPMTQTQCSTGAGRPVPALEMNSNNSKNCVSMKNSGILLIVGCLILSALHLQAAGPLAEPGAGVLTNATVQITAQDTVPAGGSVALKKIHPALLEAWREYQRQPPQSDVLRARSHLIPRPGGRLLVNIKAMVTDSVLTKIQQSGGLIENAFPKSETIRAEIPVASLETIADLTGVTDIQPAFFTDSEESATNAVHSAFGPAVNGVRPASGQPDSTNTDHLK